MYKVIILISVILLSNMSAYAQPNCGRFLCGSSYAALDRLNDATDSLIAKMKGEGTAVPKDLSAQVHQLETLNESYFFSAGISYRKVPTTIKVKDQTLSYSRYQLRGSAQGDSIAKSLLEITVPVILDPLYQFNYKYSGHFLDQKIFVGPQVFKLNLLGATTTLQHEQMHSMEHNKVHQGKMSLARLELMNSEGRRSVKYGNYFRVDEIETHLNDHHLLTDSALVAQRDLDLITQGMSPASLEATKNYRATVVKDKAQNLKRFTAESLEMLAKIKERIMHGAVPVSSKYDPATGMIRVIFTTEYKSYEYLSFDLQGLIIPADLTDWVKVREVVLSVMDWSLGRISTAQTTVKSF